MMFDCTKEGIYNLFCGDGHVRAAYRKVIGGRRWRKPADDIAITMGQGQLTRNGSTSYG